MSTNDGVVRGNGIWNSSIGSCMSDNRAVRSYSSWSISKWSRCNSSYWSSSNGCYRSCVGANNSSGSWCTECGSRFVGFNRGSESKSISDVVNSTGSSVNISQTVRANFVSMSIAYFGTAIGSTKSISYSIVEGIVTNSLKILINKML